MRQLFHNIISKHIRLVKKQDTALLVDVLKMCEGNRQKALKILGYLDEEQLRRSKALSQLGISERDLLKARVHFTTQKQRESIRRKYRELGYSNKILSQLGVTEEELLRRKAVKVLGTSESEIETERSKRLARIKSNSIS